MIITKGRSASRHYYQPINPVKATGRYNLYCMDKMLLKNITIFLTVDEQTIDSYFNMHDPSPIYKRQLSHEFEKYISSSIVAIKRHSSLRYKLVCTKESDRQYIEPLIHSIRRHFSIQKVIKESEFRKFKKGAYKLLLIKYGNCND